MSPAEEYSTSVNASNTKRQNEILAKMKKCGVLEEFKEYLTIQMRPYASYSERLEKCQ